MAPAHFASRCLRTGAHQGPEEVRRCVIRSSWNRNPTAAVPSLEVCEGSSARVVDLLEMVGAGASKLGRELRRAGAGELLSMDAQTEPGLARSDEDVSRLVDRERTLVAEHVAPPCPVLLRCRDGRDDVVDVVGAVALRRHDMGAEKRRRHLRAMQ